jgi:hypothetical protein
MRTICQPNNVGLKHKHDATIVGWLHGDEPDNARRLDGGKDYGPPIAPEKILADYERLRAADPSRPVFLNLSQGVAWDAWIGRGVRTNHPEDYPKYVKGANIVAFDIYPVTHDHDDVRGKLWFGVGGPQNEVDRQHVRRGAHARNSGKANAAERSATRSKGWPSTDERTIPVFPCVSPDETLDFYGL